MLIKKSLFLFCSLCLLGFSGCGISEDSTPKKHQEDYQKPPDSIEEEKIPKNEDMPTDQDAESGDTVYPNAFEEKPKRISFGPASISHHEFRNIFSLTLEWEDNPQVSKYWLGVGTSKKAIQKSPWGDIFSGSMQKKTHAVIPLEIFRKYHKKGKNEKKADMISVFGNADKEDVSHESQKILPPSEQVVYVRLWSKIGKRWYYKDSEYIVTPPKPPHMSMVCGKKTMCRNPNESQVIRILEVSEDMPSQEVLVCESILQTYGDMRKLQQDGAQFITHGRCEDQGCADIHEPVCAQIPVQCVTSPCPPAIETFSNICEAKRVGAEIIYPGECFPTPIPPKDDDADTECTPEYSPVCGVDNKTYGNECILKRGNMDMLHPGKCIPSKDQCTAEYKPVCGAEKDCTSCKTKDEQGECICETVKKTYGNECMLQKSQGITLYKGECRKNDKNIIPTTKSCNDKVLATGKCGAYWTGFQFNGKKCVRGGASGCSVITIPFHTIDECRNTCE